MSAIFEYAEDSFHKCEAVVEEVQITNRNSPFPGFYTATLRAKVVPSSNKCSILNVKGRVLKNGGIVLTSDHEMIPESAYPNWWVTNGSISFSGVSAGDVIHATVDAAWVCYGNVKDVPSPYYPIP
jgi:hypothetical protein